MMGESFQPLKHLPPDGGIFNRLKFYGRLLVDFQVRTVYFQLKAFLPGLTGKVMDVGAGGSPYQHLIKAYNLEYLGVDFSRSSDFGYNKKDVVYFSGERLPFETGSIDHFICTDVLEHLETPEKLIAEIHRVLKPGGQGMITIPWSVRYHYIPFDYYRFTPTKLKELFAAFAEVKVEPRGNDLVVIAAKIIVVYTRLLLSGKKRGGVFLIALAAVFSPIALLSVFVGHLALSFRLGSEDDPLGYTIYVRK